MSNLIMTYASGAILKEPSFNSWIKSCENVPSADKVIITHDMDSSLTKLYEELGFKIIYSKLSYTNLFCDRHLDFWLYLSDHGHNYDEVCICDSRDLIFQLDPFEWIKNEWKPRYKKLKCDKSFLKNFVILTSEGFKQSQSGFACIEDFEFQKDVPEPFKENHSDTYVLNGGFVIGKANAILNHEWFLWSASIKSSKRHTDQATLNFFKKYFEKNPNYFIFYPMHDNLCLHGEGVKEGYVKSPVVEDGLLINANSKKVYFVVHQWDRMEDHKEFVLSYYV